MQDFEGKTYFTKSLEVDVANNSSSKVFSKPLDELPLQDKTKIFFSAELLVEGELVSMNTLFLAELKHITFPKVTFKIKTETADAAKKKYRVHIASNKFAKAGHLSLHGMHATFSDNYFDMLPASEKSMLITLDKEIEPREFRDMLVVSSI